MTCRKAGELLSPYLDGELQPRPAAVLEAHLATCTGCRAELATLRRAVTALRTPPSPLQPEGLLAEFKLRLQNESHRPALPIRAPLFPRLLLPAGAVAAVLLAALVVSRPWVAERRGPVAGSAASDSPRMAMATPPRLEDAGRASRLAEPATANEDARTEQRAAEPRRMAKQESNARSTPAPMPRLSAPRAVAAPVEARPARASHRPDGSARRSGTMTSRTGRGFTNNLPKKRPTILLPPGVGGRGETGREERERKPADVVAQQPQAPAASPLNVARPGSSDAAGAPAPSSIATAAGGPAPSALLAESDRGANHGWVAIKIVARPEPTGQEALALRTDEAPPALQREALQKAADASSSTGRRSAKQTTLARQRQTPVAPALLAAMRREVNVQVNDVPLPELIQRLGQGAEVGLSLSPKVAADTMRATADLRGLPLYAALAKLADAAGLTIAPSGSSVLLQPRFVGGLAGKPPVWSAEWGSAPQSGFVPPASGEKAR